MKCSYPFSKGGSMKYKLLHGFYDIKDNKYHYVLNGETVYPRDGLKPTKKRITELQKKGWIGDPIEEVKEEVEAVLEEIVEETKPKK